MTSLTVGYISGMIAAAIFVLQYLLPNAAVLILVGVLGKEHNAATWSVVERELLSSAWPRLLGADSTVSTGFKPRLRFAIWLRPVCFVLITITAIVTPLGLYDKVALSDGKKLRAFAYLADTGPMGYGTPPRSPTPFGRSCGDGFTIGPTACPGTSVEITYNINGTTGDGTATIPNDDYDMRIPTVLAKLYQSGLSDQQQTVSSFFDIQSRQYTYLTEAGVQHGHPYTVAAYRQLQTLVLNDAIEAVEGLIVNTKTGGIGFRNHTIPLGVEFGAEWVEDILFIEPETECVDTNVTLEYTIPYTFSSGEVQNLRLVDQGGFANLNTTYPHYEFTNNQANPMLQERAYKAAWLTNAYNMLYLNVTRPSPHSFSYLNSKVGQFFKLDSLSSTASLRSLTTTSLWEGLVNPQLYQPNQTLATGQNYRNPFGITSTNYTDISILCEGVGGEDIVNMNNIAVKCGLVLSAAKRKDGSQSIVFEPGTWWSQSVYACASTNKASIKSVHFKYNTTFGNGLTRLQVLNVADKVYANESAKPLWGVETPQMILDAVTPLWGLVSPILADSVNLTTIRSDQLYLPGWALNSESVRVPDFQSVPGTSGPAAALVNAYDIGGFSSVDGLPDYSGESNLALFAKWQEYSKNTGTTSTILNLVWTDVAANALVGTKSWDSGTALPNGLLRKRDAKLSSRLTDTSTVQVQVPVRLYTHQIYYNWLFAIPALLLLVLGIILLSVAAILVLRGHATSAQVQGYLRHLSSGRLLAAQVYPGQADRHAPTKVWVAGVGRKHIRLHSEGAVAGDPLSVKPLPVMPSAFGGVEKVDDEFTTTTTTKDSVTDGSKTTGRYSLSPQASVGMAKGYIELHERDGPRSESRLPR